MALCFQEQTKGPENAPVARFFGLRCSQINSEIGNGCGVRAGTCGRWAFEGEAGRELCRRDEVPGLA